MIVSGGWLSPIAKREIIKALEQRYQSHLEIQSLNVALFPYPHATGEGLVFRQNGREGAPPLIRLRRFEASASWLDLLQTPRRVDAVILQGLEIRISRRTDEEKQREKAESGDNKKKKQPKTTFVIEEMRADGTLLEIIPSKPGKQPMQFEIYQLTMTSVGPNQPMRYRCELKNAKPPGLIHAEGNFGPWNVEDSGQTPVTGDYRFADADLGVFKGLSGKLFSTGNFHGPLERLEVNGQTETPDFNVKAGNHPMMMKTTFSATVDGTNGDTILHPVRAELGRTVIVAEGSVSNLPGTKGKTVSLMGTVVDGDLSDILKLGVKSDTPPLRGRINFKSKIVIPPGDKDIAEKLQLNGRFEIPNGKFTSNSIQQKVGTLSERSQGNTKSNGESDPVSALGGRFILRDGTIALSGLIFQVPGATIQLDGKYSVPTEQLDFHGTATTQAKISQMTTGFKSFLLKAVDPFFKKNGAGAVIPIHITGTRSKPSFGLELRRKKGTAEGPGAAEKERERKK